MSAFLRPWTTTFVAGLPEIRLTEEGLLHGRLDDARQLHFTGWDEVQAKIEDGSLTLGGYPILCSSPRFWKNNIERLRNTSNDQRPAQIASFLQLCFDPHSAAQRLEEFRVVSRPLRIPVQTLFFLVLILFPLLAFTLPSNAAVLIFAVLLFTHSAWIAIRFHHAYRSLFQFSATVATWKLAVYPVAALRAVDELGRELLAPFHSLAVACAIQSDSGREELARRALRDALYPVNANASDPLFAQSLARHTELSTPYVRSLVVRMGIEEAKLIHPPKRHDASIESYCPRCMSQFTHATGVCPDCPSIAVVAFPGAWTHST